MVLTVRNPGTLTILAQQLLLHRGQGGGLESLGGGGGGEAVQQTDCARGGWIPGLQLKHNNH